MAKRMVLHEAKTARPLRNSNNFGRMLGLFSLRWTKRNQKDLTKRSRNKTKEQKKNTKTKIAE